MTEPVLTSRPTSLRLREIDLRALRFLAQQDSHANASAIVRKLIDQRMRQEFGPTWISTLKDSETAA